MAKANRKKAVYSRKSRFTGKGESIENQIAFCTEYLRREHPELAPAEILIYEDEGYSGGNLCRPEFARMMGDVRAGRLDAVVCYRLDRISRNIGDFAGLIDELSRLGVSFVSIREQFDTATPMGKAMMYIASVFSQLERETIAERIRDNMHELAKSGRWLGGVTPTGFTSESVKKVTVDGKERTSCKLKLIPEEAATVKAVFQKYLEVQSLTATEAYLLQNGYRTKNSKDFTRFAVKNILSNPVYLRADREAWTYLRNLDVDLCAEEGEFDGQHGLMVYNRTDQSPHKAAKQKPMVEWIAAVGRHEGLIAGEAWVKVQDLLVENRGAARRYRASRVNEALLSGLLTCSCGAHMRPKLTDRTNSAGERVYTYVCELKERSRGARCGSRPLDGNLTDHRLCVLLQTLAGSEAEFICTLAGKRDFLSGSLWETDLERTRSARRENSGDISRLIAALAKAAGTEAENYIFEEIKALHEKEEALGRRVAELEKNTSSAFLPEPRMASLAEELRAFGGTAAYMSVEQKRRAVRAAVRKVVWEEGRLTVWFWGTEEGAAVWYSAPEGELGPLWENSKCYTHTADFLTMQVESRVPCPEKWYPFTRIGIFTVIMVQHSISGVKYAPYYIHRFPLLQPHLLLEAEKFNLCFPNPTMLESTADKLRYYRYKKGLRQRDVADFADIDRSTYVHYEEPGRDYYPLDKLAKVAELLEVEVTDLIDDYNRFLYDGQGWQVKKLRTDMGLSQLAFGKRFGVNKKTIARWEGDKVTVLKRTWEKLFGDG